MYSNLANEVKVKINCQYRWLVSKISFYTEIFINSYKYKLEFQRTHTLCTLSMHFQQSLEHAAITALQLLVTEPEIPSAAYMYIYSFAVVAQELKV